LLTPAGSHLRADLAGSSFLFSRSTWHLLHTWGAITFIIAIVAHLAMSWKRLARVTLIVLRSSSAKTI
jgi:hypothetical protein